MAFVTDMFRFVFPLRRDQGDYLRKAAQKNNVDWAARCISAGVPADPTVPEHMSALQIALSSGHFDLAKLMVDSGANVNRAAGSSTPLIEAASYGSIEAVEYLLQCKADPTVVVDGTTAVHVAARHGHASVLQMLLDQPACGEGAVSAPDASGKTPLALACTQAMGNEQVVALLVKRGAAIGATDKAGATALHTAAVAGNVGIVRMICEDIAGGKALQSAVDAKGRTPLHWAAACGRGDVATYLAKGADLSAKDAEGNTPLHLVARCLMASQAAQHTLVQTLVGAGADTAAKNAEGFPPAAYASSPALRELLAAPSTSTAQQRPQQQEPAAAPAEAQSGPEIRPAASGKAQKVEKALTKALAAAAGSSGAASEGPASPASATDSFLLKAALRNRTSDGAAADGDNWKLSTGVEAGEEEGA